MLGHILGAGKVDSAPNEGPRGPLWAAGHQTDNTCRSPDPAVALVPVN